ncbi:hypothetical protein G6F22_022113 [Rhizopus arrhizus]|nr:hypothetical protein G6F22_022113 [Rhizopus arrhizus]
MVFINKLKPPPRALTAGLEGAWRPPDAKPAKIRRYPSFRQRTMSRIVNCVKLKREAEGLDFPPYPGALGTKIWQSISKEA